MSAQSVDMQEEMLDNLAKAMHFLQTAKSSAGPDDKRKIHEVVAKLSDTFGDQL